MNSQTAIAILIMLIAFMVLAAVFGGHSDIPQGWEP
jgi:hypothetical protein